MRALLELRRRLSSRRALAACALAAPLAVAAQTEPTHDMRSMPGMEMEESKPAPSNKAGAPAKAKRKATRKAPPANTAAETEAAKSHDAMPGMDHGAMPGMGASDKPAVDHSAMPGMKHGAIPGMGASDKPPVDHSAMPGMDHDDMPGMGAGEKPATGHEDMPGMKGSQGAKDEMGGMDMGAMNMQGGPPPADARDPDAYADGLELGPMPGMHMADKALYGQVLIDQLEGYTGHGGSGIATKTQAWYGGDLDKAWFKVEGGRNNGRLAETRTEALWNHAVSTYWGTQLGVRHDFGEGPGRTWAAFGVQGLAPFWFDVEATAYVGQSGRTALRLETQYELLLTQRLVLQPDLEVNLYGKNDPEREIGSGLSNVNAGLRLRYEITRKFAPYVGVSYDRKVGNTARYARDGGNLVSNTQFLVGLRLWY